jgi:hypothetical protein
MQLERAAGAQAAYYLATGPAAFVSRRAFEAVTGPKAEWWLVETVGALVTVIGATLGSAARDRRVTPEIAGLGAGSAVALAAIDVVYVARGRIRRVYLADAAVQCACLAGWALACRGRSAQRQSAAEGMPA